jgi:hypothetical protein
MFVQAPPDTHKIAVQRRTANMALFSKLMAMFSKCISNGSRGGNLLLLVACQSASPWLFLAYDFLTKSKIYNEQKEKETLDFTRSN